VLRVDFRGSRPQKQHKDSRRRIDLAVAAVMARDRARALASRPKAAVYVLDGRQRNGTRPMVAQDRSGTSRELTLRTNGVTATPLGNEPRAMSVGSLVLIFTSIADTVPSSWLVTKAVLPSGVTVAH
jgi:hypothetical protein